MSETLKCQHCQGEVTLKSGKAKFCPTCGTKRGSSTPPREDERRVVRPHMDSPSATHTVCPECESETRLG
jgi:uncharacterized Zn ribbon protein